jgi:antitoxin MazE
VAEPHHGIYIGYLKRFHRIVIMQIQISRWGNSLGLRLPRSLAAQIGVSAGEKVDVIAQGETLVVRAVRPRWRIEDLLANMTPEAMSSAFSWGDDAGREDVGD